MTDSISLDASVIDSLAKAQTTYDMVRATREIVTRLGYAYFLVVRLPSLPETQLAKKSIISNFPPEAIRRFDDSELGLDTPITDALMSSLRPVIWTRDSLLQDREENRARKLAGLMGEYEVSSGFSFAQICPNSERYAVSILGNRHTPGVNETAALSYIAIHILDGVYRISRATQSSMPALTEREKQCLDWTAAGKTSGEIAGILDLSEHTINHYLTSVCQKLEAVNRVHAVSRAMRLGIIS